MTDMSLEELDKLWDRAKQRDLQAATPEVQ